MRLVAETLPGGGLEIILTSRGTSTATLQHTTLRRVSATTDLTTLTAYPVSVHYPRNRSNTQDQASLCVLDSQPVYPPGEYPVEYLANMSTTDKKEKLEAQIKSADMTDDMQQEAIDVAQEAMNKFTVEKDIAMHIKKTFDERKGPTWHCIVGRNFGSFVTHETKHFIYFYLGHCAILLFKTQ
ncbi:hypothetical protein VTL71DRAFT_5116 [Oculimacula yallundae]|uniref:Dynein light chain n=1 Tax=Oculimacula yallundae TaxID=86028 RepID=A0ABR4C076_9HELO